MPDKPSPLLPDDEQSRDRLRAALVACCVVAVVLAGTLVPAVSGAGLGSSPLGSVVPQPSVDPYGLSQGSGGSGSGGGLGALNPGDRTDVGGSLAAENATSAFRSQNAETHFRVQSSVPSYWRTGAYDTYTGSGWQSSGERRPYDGPIEGGGIQGREVQYRVTLQRSATALPSVWRANSVRAEGEARELYVTDSRAFETGSPVPAGTTYTGVSHLPAHDPTVLRAAGRDYPSDIERRYTDLPEDTDRRVGGLTDELTADSSSPYESAKRVESWLESNKEYSLNVSEPAGEDVASQFIFDMEKGYCEYFATSMTVMLRSQDIPARYVVGYSTGQSVGANTYEVRGMNAHAWVEAYFPEVGWVKFDPTPGQERLDAEQRAFANQTDAAASDYSASESGSPGEQFSSNGTDAGTGEGGATATSDGSDGGTRTGESGTATEPEGETPTDSTATTGSGESSDSGDAATDSEETTRDEDASDETTTATDSQSSSEYAVSLDRTPVPGATVEVTVTREGGPATGVPVFFNDERIGVTDDDGTVTGRVPYAENLRITVGSESDGDAAESVAAPPRQSGGVGAPPLQSGNVFSLTDPPRALVPGNETNSTEYDLSTDAALAVSGDVATGSEVVVTATVEDVPVGNAEVTLDGETVGTTDRNGRVRVRLPDSPGNVTLAVARGSVTGERTLSLPRLEVETDPQFPVALPGTAVEVRATYGGDPLANATVRVAGATETTDIDGTATASLPFRRSAEVVASAAGQTRRTAISGLLVNLAGVLGGAAVVLGGLGFGAYRRGLTPRRLAAALVATVRAIPDLAVAALFAAADRLSRAVETVLDALRELRAGETTVSELLARLVAWLAERAQAVGAGSLRSLGGDPAPDVSGPDDAEEADSYRTLREAWATFLRVVSVRRPGASTPGELADHAVREDDLPPGPVVTLRDAFRDVEYGARSPTDRLARVEEAAEAIERAAREEAERAARADDEPASGGDD